MTTYAVLELPPDASGGFCPRGGAKRLWSCHDHEVILSGPSETGKTWACLNKLHGILLRYPGAQAVMARKVLASLYPSCFQTYKRILGPESPVAFYGGEKPEWADYPNGSRLYFAGMDNPQKALSSERDVIYVNQAEELSLNDWEVLTTRCTGRGAVVAYPQIFGDCNPGAPSHWIRSRASLTLLESRHEDNPTLFDEQGRITEQGRRTLAVLDNLTGVRYQRLRLGKWVQAEGAVYDGFDASVHMIDYSHPLLPGGRIPDAWNRYWTIDFGYTNPFVWQDWAEDKDGRLFRVREIYQTGVLVEDHARRIVELTRGEYAPSAIICDHDAEGRATLEKHLRKQTGVRTSPARKTLSPGIQAVQARLRTAGDGWPRIFFLRDALIERDESLVTADKPFCTEREFEVYVWPKGVDGKPVKEVPVDENNHGLDAARYMVAHKDIRRPFVVY